MHDWIAARRLPPWPALIATVLVAAGVLLAMFVSKSLLFVAGLGAFGPGVLRELGWLRDHDEFQRQAAHRAGYHAYLIGGLAAVFVVSAAEWDALGLDASPEWVRFVLIVLWLSWMFSALLAYWGTRKTASRVLIAVGSFWAVFVIATLIGDAGGNISPGERILGILVGVLLIAAFFVPAWTAHRWPRATGAVLLAASAAGLVVFGGRGALPLSTVVLTQTLLVGPLLVAGFALLRETPVTEEEEMDGGR